MYHIVLTPHPTNKILTCIETKQNTQYILHVALSGQIFNSTRSDAGPQEMDVGLNLISNEMNIGHDSTVHVLMTHNK